MQTAKGFSAELLNEAANTRKMLARVPEEHLGWKPHEKSMTLGRISMHISELPIWIIRAIESENFDFSKHLYQPRVPANKQEILDVFEERLEQTLRALEPLTAEQLLVPWKLLRGEHTIYELPRAVVIRLQLNHIIHHRGQLSVFLRLLDVPVPGLYGPSADER